MAVKTLVSILVPAFTSTGLSEDQLLDDFGEEVVELVLDVRCSRLQHVIELQLDSLVLGAHEALLGGSAHGLGFFKDPLTQ